MNPGDVTMIKRAMRLAMTQDGQELPITNAFDGGGDECDLADALTCVAGPDRDGMWLAIDLQQFEDVQIQ